MLTLHCPLWTHPLSAHEGASFRLTEVSKKNDVSITVVACNGENIVAATNVNALSSLDAPFQVE